MSRKESIFLNWEDFRLIFKNSLSQKFGDGIHRELSNIKVLKRLILYDVSINFHAKTKKEFPLMAKFSGSYKDGVREKSYKTDYKERTPIDLKHFISTAFFGVKNYSDESLIDYKTLDSSSKYSFCIGTRVYLFQFYANSRKDYHSQIGLILDIALKGLTSDIVNSTLTNQSSLLAFTQEEDEKDLRYVELIKGYAKLLFSTYGFTKIIFFATDNVRILFNGHVGYEFDYSKRGLRKSDGKYLICNSNIKEKDYDEIITVSLGYNNEITIYLSSMNYSRKFIRDVLQLNKFFFNLKSVSENIFYKTVDKMKFIQREQVLRKASERDYLTKLLNRNGFYRLLAEKVPNGNHVTLIELDVDNFKKTNDTYGHDGGDAVLKHIAATMSEHFTRNTLFSRFGGEEFFILIPNKHLHESAFMLEMFRKAIEDNPVIHMTSENKMESIPVTVSSGIGSFEFKNNAKSSLEEHINQEMVNIDRALYEAKRAGKNCIFCYRNGEVYRYKYKDEDVN